MVYVEAAKNIAKIKPSAMITGRFGSTISSFKKKFCLLENFCYPNKDPNRVCTIFAKLSDLCNS